MDIRDLIARFSFVISGGGGFDVFCCLYVMYVCVCIFPRYPDSGAKPHADNFFIDLKLYTCKMQLLFGLKTNHLKPLVSCICKLFYFPPASNYLYFYSSPSLPSFFP